uniref:Uncharacterized protein aq_113 n=1 Tax=Anthurium amnicola TaxID=1678845 RepID=A0A1D1YKB1_9ARAE
MKFGKKVSVSVSDESRRNTYKPPQPTTCSRESSIFTTFDGERKQLVPQVGLHTEFAYARSLARFAANLGPVGWEIAAKQIEKALPPGTKFGRGWVGEPDAPQQCQPPLLSASPPHPSSQLEVPQSSQLFKADATTKAPEPPSNRLAFEEGHLSRMAPSASPSAVPNRPSNPMECAELARAPNYNGSFGLLSGGGGMRPNAPFPMPRNVASHSGVNGFNTAFGFDAVGKMVRAARPVGSFAPEVPMTHARVLDIVSRSNHSFGHPASASQLEPEGSKPGNSGTVNSVIPLQDYSVQNPRASWRGLSLHPKPESTPPPDLNLRFQSPGSPPSGVVVDSQQPDLALQL